MKEITIVDKGFIPYMIAQTAALLLSFMIQPRMPSQSGGKQWHIVALGLQEASDTLASFAKTHYKHGASPDFSHTPLMDTPFPQGNFGLVYNDKIRMVLHFVEKKADVACIVKIATPYGEVEAGPKLFELVNNTERIQFECTNQTRWNLAYLFYMLSALEGADR